MTIELAREGGRGVGVGVGEERLRGQLADFLLRAVLFAQANGAGVPPIVSGGLEPFGIQVRGLPARLRAADVGELLTPCV